MEVLHVVVADGLAAEHNQVISIDHVKAHEPDAAVGNCVQDNPRVTLDVELLDACPVAASLITNCVDVAAAESATVRTADGLVKRR